MDDGLGVSLKRLPSPTRRASRIVQPTALNRCHEDAQKFPYDFKSRQCPGPMTPHEKLMEYLEGQCERFVVPPLTTASLSSMPTQNKPGLDAGLSACKLQVQAHQDGLSDEGKEISPSCVFLPSNAFRIQVLPLSSAAPPSKVDNSLPYLNLKLVCIRRLPLLPFTLSLTRFYSYRARHLVIVFPDHVHHAALKWNPLPGNPDWHYRPWKGLQRCFP